MQTSIPTESMEFLGQSSPYAIINDNPPNLARSRKPTTASLSLPGQPSQVGVARSWLATLVAGLAAADEIVLAASELAANAVSHSDSGLRGGTFTIRVAIGPDLVRVEVDDAGGPWRSRSRCDQASADDRCRFSEQCGRGLAIVASLANAWGVAGDRRGRTAWCELPARS